MAFKSAKAKFFEVSVCIVLAVCAGTLWYAFGRGTPKTKIVLDGKAGMAFSGSIDANGKLMMVSGILPAEFVVSGRKVGCAFSKREAPGRLVLRVYSGVEGSFQETYTDANKGGVQAKVMVTEAGLGSSKYSKRESSMTTFMN